MRRKKEGNVHDLKMSLTPAQVRALKKQHRARRKELTVQRTIPYEAMYEDGICQVTGSYFTMMMQISGIGYIQISEEEKEYVVRTLCGIVNSLDPQTHLQYVLTTRSRDLSEVRKLIELPAREDDTDVYRRDIMDLCEKGLMEGRCDYVREKYIVVGCVGRDKKSIRGKLERVCGDIRTMLLRIGCRARILTGKERLSALYADMHLAGGGKFSFDYGMIRKTGLSTKDFIAPESLDFRNARSFRMDGVCGSTCALRITGDTLDTLFLGRLLDIDADLTVSIHVDPMDTQAALRLLSTTLTGTLSDQVAQEQKATNEGYGHDLISVGLKAYGEDIRKTLEQVQTGEDRLFSLMVLVTAKDRNLRDLKRTMGQVTAVAQQYGLEVRSLPFRQEDALCSSLPLGVAALDEKTTRTSRVIGGFVPFTGCEIFDTTGEALYAGRNRITGSLIMIDRKAGDNMNGLILGVPGSGKSFSTKEEIVCTYFATDDDILICDPESEYTALVNALHGETIVISPASESYLNPLDLELTGENEEDALKLKISFVDSLMEIMLGGEGKASPLELSIVDVCAEKMYREYLKDPRKENMPTLEDLYRRIAESGRPEAEVVAAKMERFVFGSANLFAHRTNVDVKSRVVSFDIQNLGEQMKKVAMMCVQDFVWTRVKQNGKMGKFTRYFMDEFHVLLLDELTAAYTVQMFKRFRKKGGIPTGITQNVTDLLYSPQASNILSNCEYIRMLKQRGKDAELLKKHLGISDLQMEEVTGNAKGSGLIFLRDEIVPFTDELPADTALYRLLTTSIKDRR